MVSLVGVHAEVKPLWVDFAGGPQAVEKLGLSKEEKRRQEVIFEVINTERDYVEDLETIIEVISALMSMNYAKGFVQVYIKNLQKSKIIRPKDLSVIFSNVEAILPVNNELFKTLEKRQAESENHVVKQVGDIFIRVVRKVMKT